MRQLLNRSLFWFSKSQQGLLKNFGIVNPNIARNLRYLYFYPVLQNSMRADSAIPPPTPTLNPTKSQAVEPSLPSQEPEQGNFLIIKPFSRLQIHCQRPHQRKGNRLGRSQPTHHSYFFQPPLRTCQELPQHQT